MHVTGRRTNTSKLGVALLALLALVAMVGASLLAPAPTGAAPLDSGQQDALGGAVSGTELTGDPQGVAVLQAGAGSFNGLPTAGGEALVLSTGKASDATTTTSGANDRDNGTSFGTGNGVEGNDMTQLEITLDPPAGATCVSFDFVFLSEEYPHYVGQSFNDIFTAELYASNITSAGGGQVSAPDNFAKGPNGEPLSVNSFSSFSAASGSDLNGTSAPLTATSQLDPNQAEHKLFLTVQDLGDNILDSAVVVDNLRYGTGADCTEGVTELTTTTTTPEQETTTTVEEEEPPPLPPSTYGDVHIRTPDGLAYDFQEVGEFVLLQSVLADEEDSPEGDEGDDAAPSEDVSPEEQAEQSEEEQIDARPEPTVSPEDAIDSQVLVQAHQTPWPDTPGTSVNTSVVLQVGADVLEFHQPDQRFILNGATAAMPTEALELPAGGSMELTPRDDGIPDFGITWPDGNTAARVIVRDRPFIDVGVARLTDELSYEGLLGNLDGNPDDDLTRRDGEEMSAPATVEQLGTFGDSWRTPAGESIFSAAAALPAVDIEVEPLTLDDFDQAERDEAEQTCRDGGLSDDLAIQNCVFDLLATEDEAFVESAAVFEEALDALPGDEGDTVAGTDIAAEAVGTDDDSSLTLALIALAVVVLVAALGAVLYFRSKSSGSGPQAGPPGGPQTGPQTGPQPMGQQ
jgi:hypothetical protein